MAGQTLADPESHKQNMLAKSDVMINQLAFLSEAIGKKTKEERQIHRLDGNG